MPFEITWLIPDRLMLMEVNGDVTVENILEINSASHELMATINTPLIHTILDTTRVTSTPKLLEVANVMKQINPNPKSGWTVMIMTPNPLVKWVGDFIMQISQIRYRRAASLRDAFRQFQQLDDTMDWSLLPEVYRSELHETKPR